MSHDAAIQAIIEDLLADKSIPAAYRNAVASTGRRWQCEVRGAKTMTNRQAPEDLPIMGGGCTCPEGGRRKTCPVHGEGSINGGCICTELGRRKDCPVHGGQA